MSTQEFVIQIDFLDRPGLGYEIFELFEKNRIDKIGMEVSPEQGMTIKFRSSTKEVHKLLEDLRTVNQVLRVSLREFMPYEEREYELRTILNSVSEGVVAVDREGKITHINEVACRIFHCKKEVIIGQGAEKLFNSNPPILSTLQTGKPYSLKERKIRLGQTFIHILTSGMPIIDDKGQIIGAVATINDFRQVEEIITKADRNKNVTFDHVIYQSSRMRHLVEMAKVVAKGNSTILLRGESGTGKELFAKAIHMESPRMSNSFIPINCAALPDTLLESELFGYEEGAFTGATKGGKKGVFEQANHGTLFLDEIGDITPRLQVRLLRVLQEGMVRRVGGTKEIPVDVRIIAATHGNLEDMIQKGDFREDLYYRLNVIPLKIPSLRERSEDIPLIAQYLIRKISAKLGKPVAHLTKESIQLLTVQPWPGNVRQLENTLERILNIIDTVEIGPQLFYEWTDLAPKTEQILDDDQNYCIKVPVYTEWPTLKEIVDEVEKQVLKKVLETYNSSRKAGKVLGVSNTTILNKIKSYGIDR